MLLGTVKYKNSHLPSELEGHSGTGKVLQEVTVILGRFWEKSLLSFPNYLPGPMKATQGLIAPLIKSLIQEVASRKYTIAWRQTHPGHVFPWDSVPLFWL